VLVALSWEPAQLFLIAAVPTLAASITAYVLMRMLDSVGARTARSFDDANAAASLR
jgi:nitrate/nitrite transporter NarK